MWVIVILLIAVFSGINCFLDFLRAQRGNSKVVFNLYLLFTIQID